MKDWLRYFFGSFFSNKISREGEGRSFLNSVLGLVLSIVLLVFGLSLGRGISFNWSYEKAEDFRAFLQEVSASLDESVVFDGENCVGEVLINTFTKEDDAKYKFNGYDLIVDLRDTLNLYDDFKVVGKNQEGVEISYEDYIVLPTSLKENYSLSVKYSGVAVDYENPLNQQTYIDYLTKISDKNDPSFREDIANAFSALKADAKDYKYQAYALYSKAYYADADISEKYSPVPTVRGYYGKLLDERGSEKYLMLLSDQCVCSFVGGSNPFNFTGYYTGINGAIGRLNGDFIRSSYKSSVQLYTLAYSFNVTQRITLLVVIWLVLTFALFGVCRYRKISCGYLLFGAMQIIGSFLAVSGILCFLLSLVLNLFLAQSAVYSVVIMGFLEIFVVRSVIFILGEAFRKRPKTDADGEEEILANEQ